MNLEFNIRPVQNYRQKDGQRTVGGHHERV